jgi:hypothetical protein
MNKKSQDLDSVAMDLTVAITSIFYFYFMETSEVSNLFSFIDLVGKKSQVKSSFMEFHNSYIYSFIFPFCFSLLLSQSPSYF